MERNKRKSAGGTDWQADGAVGPQKTSGNTYPGIDTTFKVRGWDILNYCQRFKML